MLRLLILIGVVLSSPCWAQLAKITGEGPTVFDWDAIRRCAANKENQWQGYCRSWLDAREEGRKSAK